MAITIPVKVKICSPDDYVIANFKEAWNYLSIFIPKSKIEYRPEFIVKKENFFTKSNGEWDFFRELEELPRKGALRMLMLDCWKTGYRSPWGFGGGAYGIGKSWYQPSVFVDCFSSADFTAFNKCGAWRMTKGIQHEIHHTLESCVKKPYIVSYSANEYNNNKERAIAHADYADAHRPIWENTCPYGYASINYCNFDCWSWRECRIIEQLANLFLKEIASTGNLRVTSTPSGAKIWIQASDKSSLHDTGYVTPHTFTLPVGACKVKVEKAGYTSPQGVITVNVVEDKTVNAYFNLEKEKWIVAFWSVPSGANIEVSEL